MDGERGNSSNDSGVDSKVLQQSSIRGSGCTGVFIGEHVTNVLGDLQVR